MSSWPDSGNETPGRSVVGQAIPVVFSTLLSGRSAFESSPDAPASPYGPVPVQAAC